MNSDQLEGKWEQLKGQVKKNWGKLTNDDIVAIKGQKDILVGKLRERYGNTKAEAERELEVFLNSCNCDSKSKSSSDKRKSDPSARV